MSRSYCLRFLVSMIGRDVMLFEKITQESLPTAFTIRTSTGFIYSLNGEVRERERVRPWLENNWRDLVPGQVAEVNT